MTNLVSSLAAYVPPDMARAAWRGEIKLQSGQPQSRRFLATVLFADVSGFTPLTEALAQKGTEGPEELTRLLNGYFSRMISLIEGEGGEVVKFSGDAMTVVFPAELESLSLATRRAKQAAEAMQAAMAEFTTLQTSVGPVALGMKIGVGAGEILAAQVGGQRGRWEYVIAGDPLRQVAEAEHQADRGEIVLSPEATRIMVPDAALPKSLIQPDWDRAQDVQRLEADLRYFVPGAVLTKLGEGLQDWLAELRAMSVLFIGVAGLDYEQPDVIDRLHRNLKGAQDVIYRYEGSINKLAVDDKGTIMIALFGAPPFSHEDDPERALRCGLDLQAMAQQQGLALAIGVTTGRVFSGPVGSETRREYTVMGDAVNLSARFMVAAGPGEMRCDYETYRRARQKLAFDVLPPVRVKGKAGLLRIYRPIGQATRAQTQETSGDLIGRKMEIGQFAAILDRMQANPRQAHCFLIEGEAGIGKSRLVEAMVAQMREQGMSGLIGMGHSIEQKTPYRAWRDIFNSYFSLDDIDEVAERQQRVADQVADIVPDQIERLPLLNDILNLDFAENDLTTALDSHLRHESLVVLLLSLLRAWAAERPLVLILEDAHWLDTLSWDLALQVMRSLTAARVSLLLIPVMRPLEGERMRVEPLVLAGMDETTRIALDSLSPEETLALATVRLELPPGGLPQGVTDLVRNRAGGNPFFAEELVYTLRDSQLITIDKTIDPPRCVVSDQLTEAVQTLPETIEGIILSRIDRLPPEEQLALKVAAVIGRTFMFPALRDTLNAYMPIQDHLLRTYLDDLMSLDLTPLEAPEPELTYIFKHIITQEVAYETLLFAQRRQLHRTVAQWYEQKFGEAEFNKADTKVALASPLAPYFPLLAHHWHQAEDREHEYYYSLLSGHWAAAQFANEDAASYFSRALDLTPETDLEAQYDLLLAREAVNDLLGEREAQAEDLVALMLLADQLHDPQRAIEATLRQANYLEVTSNYPEALSSTQAVVEQATKTQNQAGEAKGHIIWGKVLWRQGDYGQARMPLEQALTLAQDILDYQSEATCLYYLGQVHLYQDQYPIAQEYYRKALEIYRDNASYQGEADSLSVLGVSHYELGDYSKARDYWEQTLKIHQMIGDQRGEAITLGNLAVFYCDFGDYELARDFHKQGLDIRLRIDDRWGKAASLVNLSLVYHGLDDNQSARDHCEQALGIQRDIGDKHGQGYSLTYLGHALAGLHLFDGATEAYEEAKQIRHDAGQHGLVMDDLAGLARVSIAQNNFTKAQAYVDEILAWIEENGTDGIEYPLQVQLTCYQVLVMAANEATAKASQAHDILAKIYATLMAQASSISDNDLRQKFLHKVKTNREILRLWQAQATSP